MTMKAVLLALILVSRTLIAQDPARTDFPRPDFVLHNPKFKVEKPKAVLGADNTIAFYGGTDMVQVSSLSFSNDGSVLAVGSLPDLIDVWDMGKRTIIRSFKGGTTVALSADGKQLAKDGSAVEIVDISSGKTLRTIPLVGGFIKQLSFDPLGKLLLVSANGEDDKVFDLADGRLLSDLKNTQLGRFSRDGSLVVGGNAKHLIVWNTRDWTVRSDLPNGPEYVATIAADTDRDLVLVGGQATARLRRLSTGAEIAQAGVGYTNFAAFNQDGTVLLDYSGDNFGVYGSDGRKYCAEPNLGSNVVALSSNDQWVAMATGRKGTDVMVWSFKRIIAGCRPIPSTGL